MDQRGSSTLENQRLWNSLHETVRHQVANSHDAEDVVQDSFVQALEHPPREERALAAWLRTVARHLSSRRRSSHRARLQRERRAARPEHLPSFEGDLLQRSVRDDLERQVERLPQPYREVVRLRYFEELETEEVALRLGRSTGTVRVQLKRGLDRLRRDMQAGERWRLGAFLVALWPSSRRGVHALVPAGALVAGLSLGAWLCFSPGEARSTTLARRAETPATPAAGPAALSLVETPPRAVEARPRLTTATPLPPVSAAAFGGTVDVHGLVLLPDGPVPDAELLLSTADPYDPGQVVGTADPTGAFQLEGVPASAWLSARAPGASPSLRHLVASSTDGRLELRLRGAFGRLTGVVLGPDGLAANGATVRVETPRILRVPFVDEQRAWSLSAVPQETRTDAGGRFELPRFESGPERLIVTTADGAGWSGWIEPAEALLPLELRCLAQATLRGNLRDVAGQPAAARRLRIELPLPFPTRTVETDQHGDFEVSVPPGPYRLWVEATAASPHSAYMEAELASAETADLRLELSAASVVTGTLRTEHGPAAGVAVTLCDPADRRASLLGRNVADAQRLPPLERIATTDGRGRFLLAGLPAGASLVLRARDAAGSWTLRRGDVHAGEPALALEAVHALQSELVARFRGAAEQLPDWVELRSEDDGSSLQLTVSPEGELRSGPLAPGSYRLFAWTPGLGTWGAGRVTLAPGELREYEREVRPPGVLRLTVEVPTDVSASSICAVLMAQGYHTLLRGGFEGDPPVLEQTLLQGPYQLLLRCPGLAPEQIAVPIDSGLTTERTVRLVHGENSRVSIRTAASVREDATLEVFVEGAHGTTQHSFPQSPSEVEGELACVPIPLHAGARALRVQTSDGLHGEWTLPRGATPPLTLTIELR